MRVTDRHLRTRRHARAAIFAGFADPNTVTKASSSASCGLFGSPGVCCVRLSATRPFQSRPTHARRQQGRGSGRGRGR
eukprot:jgi/Tetstr1/429627/TSEL_019525.t1